MTLTGTNSFLLQEKLNSLVAAFIDEHGDLALERLDGEEATPAELYQALTSLPFLASKKLVLMRNVSSNKSFLEKAEQLFEELPDTTDVILIEPKLDKRLSYYKYLKKASDFHEFNELDIGGLSHWLVTAAKERDGLLTMADARYLVERLGTNQQRLASELEKLLLYDTTVSRASIELLTEPTPQSTIFQLLEAAFTGRTARVLELYMEQRALKVEPPQIIAMLAWQLHIVAIVKTAKDRTIERIAKEAKLNPYVVTKSATIARTLSLQELKRLIRDLLAIDTRSKREAIDSDEALQYFLLKLSIAQ